MPQTLQYRPVLIDSLISNERINSYQSVFHPANDVELMGVYLWNAHVCGALFPLIGAVEITLRNAIDQALVADLGRFWWAGGKLHYRSFAPGVDAPHPVQAVRDNFAKATRNHTAEQRRRHEPTLDGMVYGRRRGITLVWEWHRPPWLGRMRSAVPSGAHCARQEQAARITTLICPGSDSGHFSSLFA